VLRFDRMDLECAQGEGDETLHLFASPFRVNPSVCVCDLLIFLHRRRCASASSMDEYLEARSELDGLEGGAAWYAAARSPHFDGQLVRYCNIYNTLSAMAISCKGQG